MVQQIIPEQNLKNVDQVSDTDRDVKIKILSEQQKSNQRWLKIIFLLSLSTILISVSTFIFVVTITKHQIYKEAIIQGLEAGKQQSTSDSQETDNPAVKSLRIVTRDEWLAQPSREKLDELKLPVEKVIILHTGTEECTTQSACTYRARFIQDRHIGEQNFGDIGFNFLIGGDGNIYEGRGWHKMGAFVRGQNSKSIGIAFIGDYRHILPSKNQLEVTDALLVNGTKSGYLKSGYKLHGACQLQATESPGKFLYTELKKHPHWSDDLD